MALDDDLMGVVDPHRQSDVAVRVHRCPPEFILSSHREKSRGRGGLNLSPPAEREPTDAGRGERRGRGTRRDPPRMQPRPAKLVRKPRGPRRSEESVLHHDRPIVYPVDAREERLPTVGVPARKCAARSCAEEHERPGPVGELSQIRVPGRLHCVAGAAVGEDRIRRCRLERTLRAEGAGDGHHVPGTGAALRDEQVPPLPSSDEMGAFGVRSARPVPQSPWRGEHRSGPGVHRGLRDATVHDVAPCDQARAVVLPGDVRVDPHQTGDVDRLAPGPPWIGCMHQQMPAGDLVDVRGDHPEQPVMVPQRRRVYPAACSRDPRPHHEVGRTIQDIADLCPGDEVAGVVQGHTGRILEAGVDQVVVVSHPTQGWIRVIARDDRPHAHEASSACRRCSRRARCLTGSATGAASSRRCV